MADPNFWNDQQAAQTVINEANGLKDAVNQFNHLDETYENLQISHELVKEEYDEDLAEELVSELKELISGMNDFELQLLLSEPYDKNNAILELHPGAGGTESQDWGSMLLRMYTRWAEKKGFKVETLDYLPGDEAGIKSVTLLIKGHNAYGYLKAEKGVHRLVRISPFDSSGRRHTSFVSCDIMPEFNDEISIDIRTEDLKVDTYRASGAGGQHINTTDSAVRITHLPTNVVVQCQNQRSQHKNRAEAMNQLKARLYEAELQKREAEANATAANKTDIGWGHQIRSYVLQPYQLVKDLRTGVTSTAPGDVLDGDLDRFMAAALSQRVTGETVEVEDVE